MTKFECGGRPLQQQRRLALIALSLLTVVSGPFADAEDPRVSRRDLVEATARPDVSNSVHAAKPQLAAAADDRSIVAVRIDGVSAEEAAVLVTGLRCQPGQRPSRQLLADDVELLFASQRFSLVQPRWEPTPAGWILTYEVALQAEPLIIRGQSEEPSGAGHSPSPRSSRPVFPPRMEEPEELAPKAETPQMTLDEPLYDVRIEGNITIPISEIQKHVKTRPGRAATQAGIKADVDALVRTRWFATVEPVMQTSESGPVLIYRVLERPIVRRVEYRGAKKIKVEKLEALTNLKVGSPYDVSANRECARRIEEMYHEKGFAFATVELELGNSKEDREVVFVINEGSKVKVTHVEFEGNEFFSDAILELKLQTKKRILWVFGGKYDPATIPNDEASITRYYRSLGYFDMGIEHELKFNDEQSLVTIVYKIQEGTRYKVRRIDVMGNEVIDENTLRQDHTTASGDYYTERKIAGDVEKMRQKYGKLGRLFAKVDAVPRFTDEDNGVVDILYKIDEDKVYRVREINVHIAGDHPHTRTNLVRNVATIQPGDLADPQQIQRTKSRLAGAGYFENDPQNGVRLDIKRVEDSNWIQQPEMGLARSQGGDDSVVDIYSLPQMQPLPRRVTGKPPVATAKTPAPPAPKPTTAGSARVKSVSSPLEQPAATTRLSRDITPLVSPTVERDEASETSGGTDAVLEELGIIRGQSGDMLLAQGRGPNPPPQNYIYDLSPQGDPLRPAIHDPEPLWSQMPPPEFIDIDAYLAEARTGRLMFGAGVNSNSGVVGNIVLSENNFDILRPPTSLEDIWNGTAWRGAGQKFRIEALPGSQVSRYLVDWQDPYFLDSNVNLGVSGFYFTRFYRNWDEQRVGGRIRVGQQLSQRWSASAALRLEGVHISDIPSNPPELLAEAVGDNFLSTVRLSLIDDTRDAAFLPSTGHYIEYAVEQAFAEFNYTRLEVEGRQYFTTYQRADGAGKHILNVTGNFGWTGSGTPIFERFYAGGFQSFRGFAFRGVTPVENGVEVGGQFQLLGSVEYQLPVLANEMVKVVAFSDFGTVDEDVTLDNFRVAVGGGLRITVPGMGPVPIALDWAVPIVKQDFDRDQLFSFYVGINR